MQSQKRAGLGAERLEEECMGLVLVSGCVRRTTPSQSLGIPGLKKPLLHHGG